MSQRKPWRQVAASDGRDFIIMDTSNLIVAKCWDEAVAAQIVHEHNAHDDLLTACEATIKCITPRFSTYRQLQTAIAKATETKPVSPKENRNHDDPQDRPL